MNDTRSRAVAEGFLGRGPARRRRSARHVQHIARPRADIFPQLCPTREYDWIDGWCGELLYTESGYAEPDCVFRLPEAYSLTPLGLSGDDIWTVSHYEPNSRVDYVRFMGSSVIEHLTIELEDDADDASKVTWHVTYTAVDEIGDRYLAGLPADIPDVLGAMGMLERYLAAGEADRRGERHSPVLPEG